MGEDIQVSKVELGEEAKAITDSVRKELQDLNPEEQVEFLRNKFKEHDENKAQVQNQIQTVSLARRWLIASIRAASGKVDETLSTEELSDVLAAITTPVRSFEDWLQVRGG